MLSLHDLRAPAVALDWHEAVAVVAALTASLIDTRADACPAPSDVTLLPSGDLRVTGSTGLPGAPAAALGSVLGQLLDAAPCPAELRQLAGSYQADDRTGPAGQDALVAFMTALAFFERPGRHAVLAALADRAGDALERSRRLEALDALTERTRIAAGGAPWPSAAEPPAPEEPAVAWEPAAPESRWRLAVPASAAIMVFVGMAFLAASWFGDRTAPADGRAPQVEEELPISGPGGVPDTAGPSRPSPDRPPAATVSAGAAARAGTDGAAAGRAPIATPPTAPSPRPPTVGPTPAAAGPQSAATVPTPAPAAGTTPAPGSSPAPVPSRRGGVDVAISEREGRVVPSPIAPVRPPSRPAPAGRVFTSSDAQVTPAVLIRPHLPEQPPPDVPEEQIGTLEFVVTESGAVEHVHLISPANRYQERMLVAAAKTWQFRPAVRDGHPVRFRIRIRVTL